MSKIKITILLSTLGAMLLQTGCTTVNGVRTVDPVKVATAKALIEPVAAGAVRRLILNSPEHGPRIAKYAASVAGVFCTMSLSNEFAPEYLVSALDKFTDPALGKIGDGYLIDVKNAGVGIYKLLWGDRLRAEIPTTNWLHAVCELFCESISLGLSDAGYPGGVKAGTTRAAQLNHSDTESTEARGVSSVECRVSSLKEGEQPNAAGLIEDAPTTVFLTDRQAFEISRSTLRCDPKVSCQRLGGDGPTPLATGVRNSTNPNGPGVRAESGKPEMGKQDASSDRRVLGDIAAKSNRANRQCCGDNGVCDRPVARAGATLGQRRNGDKGPRITMLQASGQWGVRSLVDRRTSRFGVELTGLQNFQSFGPAIARTSNANMTVLSVGTAIRHLSWVTGPLRVSSVECRVSSV